MPKHRSWILTAAVLLLAATPSPGADDAQGVSTVAGLYLGELLDHGVKRFVP